MAMTLDELLALLPDNDIGAIDAADLRTIVTSLFDDIATLTAVSEGFDENLNQRVTTLESKDTSSTATVNGRWQVNPQEGATPQGGQMTADDWDNTTWLRFASPDLNNNQLGNAVSVSLNLYGQQKSDASNWARWERSGDIIWDQGWFQIPVTLVATHGSAQVAGWQEAVIVITVPGE